MKALNGKRISTPKPIQIRTSTVYVLPVALIFPTVGLWSSGLAYQTS